MIILSVLMRNFLRTSPQYLNYLYYQIIYIQVQPNFFISSCQKIMKIRHIRKFCAFLYLWKFIIKPESLEIKNTIWKARFDWKKDILDFRKTLNFLLIYCRMKFDGECARKIKYLGYLRALKVYNLETKNSKKNLPKYRIFTTFHKSISYGLFDLTISAMSSSMLLVKIRPSQIRFLTWINLLSKFKDIHCQYFFSQMTC